MFEFVESIEQMRHVFHVLVFAICAIFGRDSKNINHYLRRQ